MNVGIPSGSLICCVTAYSSSYRSSTYILSTILEVERAELQGETGQPGSLTGPEPRGLQPQFIQPLWVASTCTDAGDVLAGEHLFPRSRSLHRSLKGLPVHSVSTSSSTLSMALTAPYHHTHTMDAFSDIFLYLLERQRDRSVWFPPLQMPATNLGLKPGLAESLE